jgi:hypothetical protein
MLLFLSSALTSALSSAFDRLREAVRRRGLPFVLALVVEALIAIALFFFLTAGPPVPKKKPIPTVFGIDVGKDETAEPTNKTEAKKGAAPKTSARPAEAPPEPAPTPPPMVTEAPPSPPSFIRLTRRDYARGDIATLPSQGPPVGTGQPAETADLGGAGDSEVVGRAPNGEPLYAAEWHVEPTNAQLGAYISKRALGRPGVGLIACRTVARYRVEDCQELGETPVGSGYAGSVRQAAFQFLVRPPRKGGKALIGSWVRIRIDYRVKTVKEETAPAPLR